MASQLPTPWATLRQRLESAPRSGNEELAADVAAALGVDAGAPLLTSVLAAWAQKNRLLPSATWASRIDAKGPWARVLDVTCRSKAGAGAALLAATFANLPEGAPA